VGDPVKLMGFDVGEITEIIPNDPYDPYNITVYFRIKQPNYGYIWSDSTAKVAAGDLLGNRFLEVSKGKYGVPTVYESSDKDAEGILNRNYFLQRKKEVLNQYTNEASLLADLGKSAAQNKTEFYTNIINRSTAYWLDPEESPSVTERLEKVVNQVEIALPNILNLTNQLMTVLSNSATLTANLSEVAAQARPAVSNLALATAHLDQPGALGEWLLPTNINQKLDSVLGGADVTLNTANTNLAALAQSLYESLENLSSITSNLNGQVAANTNILSRVSKAVVNADNLLQGLKRHWLLRSAFKKENSTDPNSTKPVEPLRTPKMRGK
jgi:ABC-type transporter Mla subunit MlaD